MCITPEQILQIVKPELDSLEKRLRRDLSHDAQKPSIITIARLDDQDGKIDNITRMVEVFGNNMDRLVANLDDLAGIVKEQLLPVYLEDQKKNNAKQYIGQVISKWASFSGKLASLAALVMGIVWIIKILGEHV